ncbi:MULTISPECIES: restriction endonuclease subunit S [unclassified Bradyrhizobium]|uniref:restriction endonuclease subunit S n=1 Tax=Bradyrhizobium sp. USDA 4541 TaxID=2817704 RepID=UPI0020A3A1F3|nr:restriction endonuclease subunit S [Bradyrhizobium sp. USDA 4541]MCP1848389.1 type I restriction enzyme S subunit [Bradyrhizobium sp. USDA 4541]
MNAWPTVALGELLRRSERTIRLDSEATYREVTVRMNGKGVVERRQVQGREVAADRRHQAKSGQFIISRIDARHGASGLIPDKLDGAIVTNDFPLFDINTDRLDATFLNWISKTTSFVELCKAASEGTTNRVRLSEERFKALSIPLPSLDEQHRIAAGLDAISEKLQQIEAHLDAVERDAAHLLALRFRDIIADASLLPIYEVAPAVRRPVEIQVTARYREIGARSFGKGLFAKPDFDGATATWEKPVWVKSGDLVLSNIKAWEGAIAVASDAHDGCIASHRYITCVPDPMTATAGFLAYYLLSEDGLVKVISASPGTADRNRTLSLGNLGKIEVPVPPLGAQQSFDRLQAEVAALKAKHASIRAANSALLPATLERMFS